MNAWDHVWDTISSPEVVRPLIVGIVLLLVGGFGRVLSNQKKVRKELAERQAKADKDAADKQAKLLADTRTIETAVTFFGEELQHLKGMLEADKVDSVCYRQEIKDAIQDINIKIRGIDKELHPNHGSSMRDAVDRVTSKLEVSAGHLSDLKERFEDHLEVANYQIQRLDRLSEGN